MQGALDRRQNRRVKTPSYVDAERCSQRTSEAIPENGWTQQAPRERQTAKSHEARRLVVEDYLKRVEAGEERERYDGLTAREKEILTLIAQGSSNQQIAGKLYISIKTVQTHRAHILEKNVLMHIHVVHDLLDGKHSPRAALIKPS